MRVDVNKRGPKCFLDIEREPAMVAYERKAPENSIVIDTLDNKVLAFPTYGHAISHLLKEAHDMRMSEIRSY